MKNRFCSWKKLFDRVRGFDEGYRVTICKPNDCCRKEIGIAPSHIMGE
jgi:hypothetical protein